MLLLNLKVQIFCPYEKNLLRREDCFQTSYKSWKMTRASHWQITRICKCVAQAFKLDEEREGWGGDVAGPLTQRATGKRSQVSEVPGSGLLGQAVFLSSSFAASCDSCNYWTEITNVFQDHFSTVSWTWTFAHDRNHQTPQHLDHEGSRVAEWLLPLRWLSETFWKLGPAPKTLLRQVL